jgi:pyridoxamine 5'-phosphate oxidase
MITTDSTIRRLCHPCCKQIPLVLEHPFVGVAGHHVNGSLHMEGYNGVDIIEHMHEITDNRGSIMKQKAGKWDTLEAVLNDVWRMLERGVSDYKDPFHCPILGTSGTVDSHPRTVILRQFILPERMLVCHTDARSKKVQEISDHPNVSWLFYHRRRGIQLRISGPATLHADDQFADQQWAATKLTSRLNYCATAPPGTPIDKPSSGLPDFLVNKVPTLLDSEKGRKNFMAIACRMNMMDCLMLRPLGNRRARFDWYNNELHGTWVIP